MFAHRWRALVAIVVATVAVDWLLGVLIAGGRLPIWTYLLANVPFGVFHVGLESTWTGTRYVVAGRTVGDGASFAVLLVGALAQGTLYFALLDRQRRRQVDASPA